MTGAGEWADIRVAKVAKTNISLLMKRMELSGVPIGYAHGLKRISITPIDSCDDGLYHNDRIKVSCRDDVSRDLCQVLAHELAHHLHDHKAIEVSSSLRREFRRRARFLPDSYARESVYEYVAVGFEVYYFANEKTRSRMRTKNPVLYSLIKKTHKQHLNSGI